MFTRMKTILAVSIIAFSFVFSGGCAHARPPKPGPHFVWVPVHAGPHGRVVPGHWKYTGPAHPHGKYWVAGHFNKAGVWVPGHWIVR